MKSRPIPFTGPMVRAILEGRKTMTRRIFSIRGCDGKKYVITSPAEEIVEFNDGTFNYLSTAGLSGPYPCPYGKPGDRLWVKESAYYWGRWERAGFTETCRPRWRSVIEPGARVIYQAHAKPEKVLKAGAPGNGWIFRPGMFMPRWASRGDLDFTSVRVERLQDISASDIEREGAITENTEINHALPIWIKLWESINGTGSWDKNPWVWVVKFKRHTEADSI